MFLYILCVIALLIIGITAVARLNDIKRDQLTLQWHARRLGLVLIGVACVVLVVRPLYGFAAPSAWEALLYWGQALTWITTPNMPPWHKYIVGGWSFPHVSHSRRSDDAIHQ